MTVELRENLCEDKTTEFIWRCEESMCVRFSQFAAHDEFVICVWKKNDSESRDESEKIFDVNKKYSERISKSSLNHANINHKENNIMKHLSHCRAKSQMRRRLIKKDQKNSRIENSRIASTMIVLVYAKRNIRSTIVFIWSRTFARLNENRTKKLWRKSKKFSK
jgi:hypothetical protein